MTGDDIADAVLDFCVALALESTAETVQIPVLQADGSRGTASRLVKPASPIVAPQVDTDFDESIDEQTIRLLHTRTLAHRPVAQHAVRSSSTISTPASPIRREECNDYCT